MSRSRTDREARFCDLPCDPHLMSEHREWAVRNRDRIASEWHALPAHPIGPAHVPAAREEMGEERWAELNAEWRS